MCKTHADTMANLVIKQILKNSKPLVRCLEILNLDTNTKSMAQNKKKNILRRELQTNLKLMNSKRKGGGSLKISFS